MNQLGKNKVAISAGKFLMRVNGKKAILMFKLNKRKNWIYRVVSRNGILTNRGWEMWTSLDEYTWNNWVAIPSFKNYTRQL